MSDEYFKELAKVRYARAVELIEEADELPQPTISEMVSTIPK